MKEYLSKRGSVPPSGWRWARHSLNLWHSSEVRITFHGIIRRRIQTLHNMAQLFESTDDWNSIDGHHTRTEEFYFAGSQWGQSYGVRWRLSLTWIDVTVRIHWHRLSALSVWLLLFLTLASLERRSYVSANSGGAPPENSQPLNFSRSRKDRSLNTWFLFELSVLTSTWFWFSLVFRAYTYRGVLITDRF